MQHHEVGSSHLRDLHPYIKTPDPELKRIPVAFGRAGVVNLVRCLREDLSETALVNTLILLLDQIKAQEGKLSAIKHGIVAICESGLKSDWAISEYVSMADAEQLIEARSLALQIVGEISMLPQGRRVLMGEEIMSLLVSLLTEKFPQVRASACQALSTWCCFPDGVRTMLEVDLPSTSLVPRLVDADMSVSLAMSAVFANVTSIESGIQLALKCDIMKYLVTFLSDSYEKQGKLRRKMLCEVLTTIWNMAHDEKGNACAIREHAVEAICNMMRCELKNKWSDVERYAAGALKALAISEDGKKRVSAYGVQVVTQLVASKNLDTQTNASTCIRLSSEYPDAKKQFVASLLPDTSLLKLVYGIRSLRALVPHLLSGSPTDEQQAVVAVEVLIATTDGHEEAMQCLKMVYALARLMISKDSKTARIAGNCVTLLCKAHTVACKQLAKMLCDSDDDFGPKLKRTLATYPGLMNKVVKYTSLFKSK